MQCPVDQRVDQKFNQRLAKNHLPRQYLDIALVQWQYLDIALEAEQYKIYCPAKAFDLPMQSVTYLHKHALTSNLFYLHFVFIILYLTSRMHCGIEFKVLWATWDPS